MKKKENDLSKVRVRFAPSPTGFVHIGSMRTALYNYLFAKNMGGTFVLRIEDTDRARFVEGAVENLMSALEWAGLNPDEGPQHGGEYGPYFQSERTEIYVGYARQLVEKGFAYLAFDTPQELEAMRNNLRSKENPAPTYNYMVRNQMRNSLVMSSEEVQAELDAGTPHVVRLFVPENRQFEFQDIIRDVVKFDSRQVDDTVLIKSDGFPTYHLANVVDDHLMKISHVIRGEEWLSSVPKHLLLYEYFGWQPPLMAHLPLIFNPDGTKMSKRNITSLDELPAGKVDPDISTYINNGYDKEAILNYIALLGWNPGKGDERQVFSMEDLVNEFSLERVNKSSAIFDIQKLNWINGEHLSKRDTALLAIAIKPELEKRGLAYSSESYLYNVIDLLKSRIRFIHELISFGTYFFTDPTEYDEKGVKKRWKSDSKKLVLEFCKEISILEDYKKETIEETVRKVAEKNEVGGGKIIHPVRLCVTGTNVGPGLFEILELLGQENVTRRLKKGVERLADLS